MEQKNNVILQQKLLFNERASNPDNVTDREISLLNDIFESKSWKLDEIASIMTPTVERNPSKEQIALLMNGSLKPYTYKWDYWFELYSQQEENDSKGICKNIIQASNGVYDCADRKHALAKFYVRLIKIRNKENSTQNKLTTNSELASLMTNEFYNNLMSDPSDTPFLQERDFMMIKKFVYTAAEEIKNHSTASSKCIEIIKSIHNIEKEQLRREQKSEENSVINILGLTSPIKAKQKEMEL